MATLAATPKDYSEALEALQGKASRKIGNNTYLEDGGPYIAATLHGHTIVRYWKDGRVEASWQGYGTSTTRDRLNQLTRGRWQIRQFATCLNGSEVDAYTWHAV